MSLANNTQLRVIKRTVILTSIIIGIILVTLPTPKKYIYGVIFGASINILNFRLMSITLEKSVNMPKRKIMPYVVGNYLIRYIIYGIILAIAAIADYISFIAVAGSLFMVKIVIISDSIYETIRSK